MRNHLNKVFGVVILTQDGERKGRPFACHNCGALAAVVVDGTFLSILGASILTSIPGTLLASANIKHCCL